MYRLVVLADKRERLWKLGSIVRARIYQELQEKRAEDADEAVNAITYPTKEESMYGHAADDD